MSGLHNMNNYPEIRDMFMEYTVDDLKYLCANLLKLLKESGIKLRKVNVPAKASGIPPPQGGPRRVDGGVSQGHGESRGSRRDLREPGGETPPGYSPT